MLKKSLKIILLIISFTVSGFVGVGAMQPGGYNNIADEIDKQSSKSSSTQGTENNIEDRFRERLDIYLNKLKNEMNVFSAEWLTLLLQCRAKNQKEIFITDLDKFAFLYVAEEYIIYLDKHNNINEKKVLACLAEYDIEFLTCEFSNEDKEKIKRVFIYCREILDKNLKLFRDTYKDYKEKLDEKIEKLRIMLKSCNNELKDFIRAWHTDAIKNRINVYLENLNKKSNEFQKEWDDLLIKSGNKKELSKEDFNNFVNIYTKLASNIFLTKDEEVDEEKFLEELSEEDKEKYDDKLDEEDKKNLKKAFIEQIKIIKEALRKFYKAHKDDKEKLDKKIILSNKSEEISGMIFGKTTKNFIGSRINIFLEDLNKKSNEFQKEWDDLLIKSGNKKELSKEDFDNFVNIYTKLASSIFLNKDEEVDEEKFLKELSEEDKEEYNYKLDEEDKENLKKAFVEQIKIIKEALEKFYKDHKEYLEKFNEKINKDLPLNITINIKKAKKKNKKKNSKIKRMKAKIDEYIKSLLDRADIFKIYWYTKLMECQGKEKLSEKDLDQFVGIYMQAALGIALDQDKNMSEENLHKCLEAFDPNFSTYTFDEEDKEKLKKAFIAQAKIIDDAIDEFCVMHKNYREMLRYKIIELKGQMLLNDELTVPEIWFKNVIKTEIETYLKNLSKKSDEFQKFWDACLLKYQNKKDLKDEDLDEFVFTYVMLIKDIFLDEAGDVDEKEFLKKIGTYEEGVKECKIEEDDRKKLRKAFIFQIDVLNKALEQFNKTHEEYKEKLKLKIDQNISANVKACFTTTLPKNVIKSKIDNFLKALSIASNRFKKEWNSYLLQCEKQKELTSHNINSFVLMIPILTNYMFLDMNGNVDEKEFLKKLSNYDEVVLKYELDEEDKEKLKNAFEEQNKVIEDAVKRFCEKYPDYEEELYKILNQKIISGIKTKFTQKNN